MFFAFPNLLGLTTGLGAGYLLFQNTLMLRQLAKINVADSLAIEPPVTGIQEQSTEDTPDARITRVVEDGIERVIYRPHEPKFETPILFQHGMWHGAWCWEPWQRRLAVLGWESHAISLPGHSNSPEQRPIKACTMDYYLRFLKREVERLPRRPILIGHSVGGALVQWYFKYVADDLPAAVLVASLPAQRFLPEGFWHFFRLDPLGMTRVLLTQDAAPAVRSPDRVRDAFLSPQAYYEAERFYDKLSAESLLPLYQHNPPFWEPPQHVRTPLLWLAGEVDPLLPVPLQTKSAAHYEADFQIIKGAGHDIMLEHNYHVTLDKIHDWLINRI